MPSVNSMKNTSEIPRPKRPMGDNLIGVGCIDNIDVERHKAPQQRRCEGTDSAAKANFDAADIESFSVMVAGTGPRDQQHRTKAGIVI